jgi:hypothetical protein
MRALKPAAKDPALTWATVGKLADRLLFTAVLAAGLALDAEVLPVTTEGCTTVAEACAAGAAASDGSADSFCAYSCIEFCVR